MIKRNILYLFFFLLYILYCGSPDKPPVVGYTAKAAENWASTRALQIWGNPILVSIEAPETGGGVNRDGKLSKGADGKWLFGYFNESSSERLIIEVVSNKARESLVPGSYLPVEDGIETYYKDSSDALAVAEKNGGKNLENVELITCKLLGEHTWPIGNPKKVAWEVLYKMKNGSRKFFYIEAYSGVYLGDG